MVPQAEKQIFAKPLDLLKCEGKQTLCFTSTKITSQRTAPKISTSPPLEEGFRESLRQEANIKLSDIEEASAFREFMQEASAFEIPGEVFDYETLRQMQLSFARDVQYSVNSRQHHFTKKGKFVFQGRQYTVPTWASHKMAAAKIALKLLESRPDECIQKFTPKQTKLFRRRFKKEAGKQCPEKVVKPKRN